MDTVGCPEDVRQLSASDTFCRNFFLTSQGILCFYRNTTMSTEVLHTVFHLSIFLHFFVVYIDFTTSTVPYVSITVFLCINSSPRYIERGDGQHHYEKHFQAACLILSISIKYTIYNILFSEYILESTLDYICNSQKLMFKPFLLLGLHPISQQIKVMCVDQLP